MSPPPVFLYSGFARDAKVNHASGNVLGWFGKAAGVGIAPATVMALNSRKKDEEKRKFTAYYLMEIINKALPPYNSFPELNRVLSNDPRNPGAAEPMLRKLGGELLTRFHPKSNWTGLHIPESRAKEFYEGWRSLQERNRNQHRAEVGRNADDLGLNTVLMGNNFGIVMIRNDREKNKSKKEYQQTFRQLGSDSLGPQEMIDKVRINHQDATWIPWYIVSFIHPKGPVDLVNFVSPGQIGERLRSLKSRKLIRDLAGSIIPLSNWVIQGVNKAWENHALKNGDTEYLNRLESFATASALAETQVHLPLVQNGIASSYLQNAVRRTEHKNFKIENLKSSEVMNSVAALLLENEEKFVLSSKSLTHPEDRNRKIQYTNMIQRELIEKRANLPVMPDLIPLQNDADQETEASSNSDSQTDSTSSSNSRSSSSCSSASTTDSNSGTESHSEYESWR